MEELICERSVEANHTGRIFVQILFAAGYRVLLRWSGYETQTISECDLLVRCEITVGEVVMYAGDLDASLEPLDGMIAPPMKFTLSWCQLRRYRWSTWLSPSLLMPFRSL